MTVNYITTLIKDININKAETTKVALKTNFSRPRLVNEVDPPEDLAKPVPLDCMNIITIRVIARRV